MSRTLRCLERAKARGSVLLIMAFCILVMIGAIGLVVDLGRAFITKSEIQTFCDSATLAATMELDGTSAGIQRARAQVAANTNTWNLATTTVSNPTVAFSQSSTGPWDTNPIDPKGYLYANVTAQAPLPLYFIPITSSQPVVAGGAFILFSSTLSVSATSASGQELVTVFPDGVLPFSPYAQSSTGPDFGLVPGQDYTLRWASNPRLDQNTCAGDNTQAMINLAGAGGGSERGYIEDTSAAAIRAAIEDGILTYSVQVGGTVNMTGGAKQTELTALGVLINQDTDTSSATYSDYINGGTGNGRRLVAVPINSGYPNYTVMQIAGFFLQPTSQYSQGGNNAWCAEYVGPWVKGATNKGAGDSGAYVPKLVK